MTSDKFFSGLKNGDIFNFRKPDKIVGNNIVNGFTIDTCDTFDEGYETGIEIKGQWHIVERYKDKKDAIKGHKKWCKIFLNPPKKIKSLGWSDSDILDSEVEVLK